MKYNGEKQNSAHYVFDPVKVSLKLLNVDVEPVFERHYLSGKVEELTLSQYEAGHRYVAYKDIKDIPIGKCKHGIKKKSENRFQIMQVELFDS